MDKTAITTIPINSLITLPEIERKPYIEKVFSSPKKVQDILFSTDTASFIFGLVKSFDVSKELAPQVALSIFRVAIGEKTLTQLPSILSTELQLSNEVAQRMASEIERDIFGPIKEELNSSPASISPPRPRITPQSSQPQNLLDLKEIAAAKKEARLAASPIPLKLPPKPPVPKPSPTKQIPPITPLNFT